jgi:hypothetical protein
MAKSAPHPWTAGFSHLSGIRAGDWLRLLAENGFAVHPDYWPRALMISLFSLGTSVNAWWEEKRYGAAIAGTEIVEPPVFILGHWRSGTTLLHNLLAGDHDRFAVPNGFQASNLHDFITTEKRFTRMWGWAVPQTRPMDGMPLGLASPQEDQFALCLLTFSSYYLSFAFPDREQEYARYLTFRGVAQEEIDRWKAALLGFLKKLTLLTDKRLVLKSPTHTGRIRFLLECLPDARFIHIHRNPYVVFQSSRHLFKSLPPYTTLQRPQDGSKLDDRILERYRTMYEAFFEQRSLIPPGHFHEIAFEDLERDPAGQLEILYKRLGLPGFKQFRPKLVRHLESISGYRKNRFPQLTASEGEQVAATWGRSFDEWGYQKRLATDATEIVPCNP